MVYFKYKRISILLRERLNSSNIINYLYIYVYNKFKYIMYKCIKYTQCVNYSIKDSLIFVDHCFNSGTRVIDSSIVLI